MDGLTAPTVLPDSGDVLRRVKNDGAIGFVSEGDISQAQKVSSKSSTWRTWTNSPGKK